MIPAAVYVRRAEVWERQADTMMRQGAPFYVVAQLQERAAHARHEAARAES